MIEAAGLSTSPDGSGDIALALRPDRKIAYLVLWPHARPWKLAKAEPALRGIADAAAVARVLGRALAASSSQPVRAVSVATSSRAGGSHVPAAA
jgi:hypothetical protein